LKFGSAPSLSNPHGLRRTRTTAYGGPLRLPHEPAQRHHLYGAAIFGAGFGLTGACPGGAIAMVVTGSLLVLISLGGGILLGGAEYPAGCINSRGDVSGRAQRQLRSTNGVRIDGKSVSDPVARRVGIGPADVIFQFGQAAGRGPGWGESRAPREETFSFLSGRAGGRVTPQPPARLRLAAIRRPAALVGLADMTILPPLAGPAAHFALPWRASWTACQIGA
jgi:hypothetical protein